MWPPAFLFRETHEQLSPTDDGHDANKSFTLRTRIIIISSVHTSFSFHSLFRCPIKPINLIRKQNQRIFGNLILNMSFDGRGAFSQSSSQSYPLVIIYVQQQRVSQKNIVKIRDSKTLSLLFPLYSFFLSSYQIQNCSFIHSHSQNNITIFRRIEEAIILPLQTSSKPKRVSIRQSASPKNLIKTSFKARFFFFQFTSLLCGSGGDVVCFSALAWSLSFLVSSRKKPTVFTHSFFYTFSFLFPKSSFIALLLLAIVYVYCVKCCVLHSKTHPIRILYFLIIIIIIALALFIETNK